MEGMIIECKERGLTKKVLSVNALTFDNPDEVSKVVICVEQVKHLNGRPSKYLAVPENLGKNQEMIMGTAITPIDYCLERLVCQMIPSEKSLMTMKTKRNPDQDVTCIVTLKKILENKGILDLSVKEVYDLALRYKENGVAMYKEYNTDALAYFKRALKCLHILKPFDQLKETKEKDGIDKEEIKALFNQIKTNCAACLLNEKRYEEVILVLKFIEKQDNPTEKSVYRRALAFYNLKEYERAIKTMEKIPNYMANKDFALLHKKIMENWGNSKAKYNDMIKRMFN